MLFVVLNSGGPLNETATIALRIAAVVMFVATAVLGMIAVRARRERVGTGSVDEVSHERFGRRYLIVVGVEILVLFAGFQVLRLVDAPSQAGVAWVAVVVGVHFIALSRVWRERSILVPGALLTLFGIAGLVVAGTDSFRWVPVISGVLSGFTLLLCSLYVAARDVQLTS